MSKRESRLTIILIIVYLLTTCYFAFAQEEPVGTSTEEIEASSTGELISPIFYNSPLPPLFLGDNSLIRYEYYNVGNDDPVSTRNIYWRGQSIIASSTHNVNIIKILAKRQGIPSNPLYIDLFLADESGFPTGATLTSGTINPQEFEETEQWYDISVNQIEITNNLKYTIIGHITGGDDDNKVLWGRDYSSPQYAQGTFIYSNNSGGSWIAEPEADLLFEVWGEEEIPPAPPTTATDTIIFIENTTTGAFFYLDRTITYGDCLIFFILLLILLLLIIKFIFDLEIPRRITAKKT